MFRKRKLEQKGGVREGEKGRDRQREKEGEGMWCALDCIILKMVPNLLPHSYMSIVRTLMNMMHPGGGLSL